MIWLARGSFSNSELAQKKLFNNYNWHQQIWKCFPQNGQKRSFLSRNIGVDGGCILYILSTIKPINQLCKPENWAIKEVSPKFFDHDLYRFDLLANPTKKIQTKGYQADKNNAGKRVGLYNEEQQLLWLKHKGSIHGFVLHEDAPVVIDPTRKYYFQRINDDTTRQKGFHIGVRFSGVLRVTDKKLFIEAFQNGIGSAKAFGFGMLMLQRIV